jgi:quercetin dioxygenase-like cupin family protein
VTQDEAAAGGVKHVPPGEGEALWVFGELQTYTLAGEDTGGAFTAFEMTVAPQSAPPPHIHHQADETFYVLEGTLEVSSGDRTIEAATGSWVYVPRGTIHTWKNVGAEPAKMLVLFTPAGSEGYFKELGEPAVGESWSPPPPPPSGPPDVGRIVMVAGKYGTEILPPPR